MFIEFVTTTKALFEIATLSHIGIPRRWVLRSVVNQLLTSSPAIAPTAKVDPMPLFVIPLNSVMELNRGSAQMGLFRPVRVRVDLVPSL